MPRIPKTASRRFGSKTLVVDNGAHSIKAGFVTHGQMPSEEDCIIIPNCIARGMEGSRSTRIYVGGQLDECKDFAEMTFRRPVEKGFIVNWDAQLDIWKEAFFTPTSRLYCDPHDTNLILTEAPNCPQALQHNVDQMIFEELEFASAFKTTGAALNAYNDITALYDEAHIDASSAADSVQCLLVVDSGYSHTTITPVFRGHALQSAVRRLDIGGRFLTNHLKELISLRQFNLMDDTHLVEQIKEDVSFISQSFADDLRRSQARKRRNKGMQIDGLDNDEGIILDYVLPDYHTTVRGHIRSHDAGKSSVSKVKPANTEQSSSEDALILGNERFVPPELLFVPTDIGMAQAGIPEMIVQSLETIPSGMWPVFLANVLVVGGSASLPGLVERLETELQQTVPSECLVRIRKPTTPKIYTWLGAARFGADREAFQKRAVTYEEYQEHGSSWTSRYFSMA